MPFCIVCQMPPESQLFVSTLQAFFLPAGTLSSRSSFHPLEWWSFYFQLLFHHMLLKLLPSFKNSQASFSFLSEFLAFSLNFGSPLTMETSVLAFQTGPPGYDSGGHRQDRQVLCAMACVCPRPGHMVVLKAVDREQLFCLSSALWSLPPQCKPDTRSSRRAAS